MIVGESGTGKEHVAQLIHERSNRASGPFIAVDCGSYPWNWHRVSFSVIKKALSLLPLRIKPDF